MKTWDRIWLDLACGIATRSTCKRLHVGCVVVDVDNRIVGTGYNGHEYECTEKEGACGTVHAEDVAVDEALESGFPEHGTLYVSHAPCLDCARIIATAAISRVVFERTYRITGGVDYLRSKGIIVEQLMPEFMQ